MSSHKIIKVGHTIILFVVLFVNSCCFFSKTRCDKENQICISLAEEIVEYLEKYLSENSKLPVLDDSLSQFGGNDKCKKRIQIYYESDKYFFVSYYLKPLGPYFTYNSKEKKWSYEE